MADREYESKIKITGDTSGAEKIGKAYEDTGKKAESAGRKSASAFDRARAAAQRYNRVVSTLTKFSIFTSGISSLINLWDRLTGSAREAKEETAKLAVETAKAADAKRIDALTESYKKLSAEISNAAKERQHANELEDMQTSEADRLEDNEAKLAKAQQIAALDPNDQAYEEKKKRIENAYEVAAAKRSVDRTRRDAETKEKREYEEAAALHGEAQKKQESLIGDKAELDMLRKKAGEASYRSETRNEFDKGGIIDSWAVDLKRFVTLDWGRMFDDRTDKGDEERKRQAEEAKRYEEAAKALAQKIKEREDEIAAIDKEATYHSKRAGVYGISAANTSVAQEEAAVSGAQATAAAEKAVSDKVNQRADAAEAYRLLKQQKDDLEARKAAAQARKDAANLSVFNAEGDYESAERGGNKRQQQSAYAKLQQVKSTAQDVAHEADKEINELNETLKNIVRVMQAARSELEKAKKQTLVQQAEAISGD